mmetsp:Transcript_106/g.273  ORF Transcript_106/g.273 Transcript_106/m.273 type:complete len:524 (-) Transcript_106:815-2386(-)
MAVVVVVGALVCAYAASGFWLMVLPSKVYTALVDGSEALFCAALSQLALAATLTVVLKTVLALCKDAMRATLRDSLCRSLFSTLFPPRAGPADVRRAAACADGAAEDARHWAEWTTAVLVGRENAESGLLEAAGSLAWYAQSTARRTGLLGLLVACLWGTAAAALSAVAARGAARAVERGADCEQELRERCGEVLARGEEIAMWGFAAVERQLLLRALRGVRDATWPLARARFWQHLLQNAFAYYILLVMYGAIGVAVFTQHATPLRTMSAAERAGWISETASVFISLLHALSSLIQLGPAVSKQVAYTNRLDAVLGRIHLNDQRAKPRAFVSCSGTGSSCADASCIRRPRSRPREEAWTRVRGPSGCGKTTLVRALREGSCAEQHLQHMLVAPHHQDGGCNVQVLPTKSYLPRRLTLLQQVVYPLDPRGGVGEAAAARTALSAARLESLLPRLGGLDGAMKDWSAALSAGEQQRMCLARVFFHRPCVVLADEALTHLDPLLELELLSSLREQCPRTRIVYAT